MSNQKALSYKVGFGLGRAIAFIIKQIFGLIWFLISGFFKLIFKGVVKASMRFKITTFVYIGLVIATLVSLLVFKNGYILLVDLLVVIINAIVMDIKERPMRKKREFFDSMFDTLNFKAHDEVLPYLLDIKEISEFVTECSFKTLIPLDKWLGMKDNFEMYMNEKIIEITQGEINKRIICLYLQTASLPYQIAWSDEYLDTTDTLYIGVGYYGKIGMDLARYPHAFIAGETGCGKSNILKCMIYQAIWKKYDVILIDFKRGVAFSDFTDTIPVYYDYKEVMAVLRDLVQETMQRLDGFREARVDNIQDYNYRANNRLKRKIVFIDELAELLKTTDKETSRIIYDAIITLTRLSRAAGIHLIMGIQRPDSTIVSGQIKNNVSYRVCGRFVDKEPSRIMLGNDMASALPNIKGRFIAKDDNLVELQSFKYFYRPVLNIANTVSLSNENERLEYGLEPVDTTRILLEEVPHTETPLSKEFEFDFSEFKQ